MTLNADYRGDIIHDQEIAKLVVVRIVTSRALQLTRRIQPHRRRNAGGRPQFHWRFRIGGDFVG